MHFGTISLHPFAPSHIPYTQSHGHAHMDMHMDMDMDMHMHMHMHYELIPAHASNE